MIMEGCKRNNCGLVKGMSNIAVFACGVEVKFQ